MTDTTVAIPQWLAEARAGSREALGRALDACRNYLLLIAEKNLDHDLRAKGGASDLVQETFLEAQRDFHRFAGQTEAEWLAWLRQMLLHNVANFTRSYRQSAKRQTDREVSLAGRSSAVGLDPLAEDRPPDAQLQAREEADTLRRALDRMPEDYRQVLTWRYQDGLSFAEIARRLGRTENAARKLFARAVERLQVELGPDP